MPGGRSGRRNPPSDALVASRLRPVVWEVALSLVPAITAPEGSTTFPVMEPVGSAAYMREVKTNETIGSLTIYTPSSQNNTVALIHARTALGLEHIWVGTFHHRGTQSLLARTKPAGIFHFARAPPETCQSGSFSPVLCSRFLPRLPPHILDRIGHASPKWNQVVGHISRTRPNGLSCRWTRARTLETSPYRSASRNPPTAVTGAGLLGDHDRFR